MDGFSCVIVRKEHNNPPCNCSVEDFDHLKSIAICTVETTFCIIITLNIIIDYFLHT